MKFKVLIFSAFFVVLISKNAIAAEKTEAILSNTVVATETNETTLQESLIVSSNSTSMYDTSTQTFAGVYNSSGQVVGGISFYINYSYIEGEWSSMHYIDWSSEIYVDGYDISRIYNESFINDNFFTCLFQAYNSPTGLYSVYSVDIWCDVYGSISQNMNYLYSYY